MDITLQVGLIMENIGKIDEILKCLYRFSPVLQHVLCSGSIAAFLFVFPGGNLEERPIKLAKISGAVSDFLVSFSTMCICRFNLSC